MADNLAGVLDLIQREIREPAESDAIKQYIRDFLFDMAEERFVFCEKSTTFSFVSSQSKYKLGEDGVPGNVRRVDLMRVLEGSAYTPIRQVSMQELREKQSYNQFSSNRPEVFCHYAQAFEFWPTPSSTLTVYLDYQADPTLDKITGQAFDESESDNEFTNEFFREGRALLTSYVLIRWGLGRGRDPELVQSQTAVYNKVLARLRKEYAVAKWGDGCAAMNP